MSSTSRLFRPGSGPVLPSLLGGLGAAVVQPNLFLNGSAEDGTSVGPWSTQGTVTLAAPVVGDAVDGSRVFRITGGGSGQPRLFLPASDTDTPTVATGEQARIDVWMRQSRGAHGGGLATISVRDNVAGDNFSSESWTYVLADGWVLYSLPFTVPAGRTADQYYIGFSSGDSSMDFDLDLVSLRLT